MRIAFFTNCYKPLINGVVSSIISLREAYQKKGHQVYIFAPRVEGYIDEEENIFRYHSVNLTTKVKYPIAIPMSIKASRVIKQFNPNIIHIHHPFILSMPAIMYATRLKIPKILTIHTQYERYAHYISPIPRIVTNEAIRRIIFNLADKIDVITTPSQSMKILISLYKVKKEIVVVPNAINLSEFQKQDKEKIQSLKKQFNLNKTDVVMVYVGRISREKNIDKIISAMGITNKKGIRNMKLLLVGDGPAKKQLQHQIESLGLEKLVTMVGAINSDLVKYYYQLSDLFIFASTSETFGMVIVEALATGIPVLAIKGPGIVDIITDGFDGILVEDDVFQFAQGLEKLIIDEDLRRRLAQGALKTAQLYSADAVSEQMLSLYQKLTLKYS